MASRPFRSALPGSALSVGDARAIGGAQTGPEEVASSTMSPVPMPGQIQAQPDPSLPMMLRKRKRKGMIGQAAAAGPAQGDGMLQSSLMSVFQE